MTEKRARRFPLPLSSVVDSASRKDRQAIPSRSKFVAPQTAAKNVAIHIQTVAKKLPPVSTKPTQDNAKDADSGMLVSEAVRRAMVDRLAKQGIQDRKVLAAMEAAPRHRFLDPALASQAYIDASLPIGHQQTISQPYIVARMIEILLDNHKDGALDRVLEIGTGCGYQAMVLSRVAKEVYSIERIKALHDLAKNCLRPLRVPNIRLHFGDGMVGLPQAAPFDGIILAAAGLDVPQALLDQLAIGGRLVAPVGSARQMLELIERTGVSTWTRTMLEECHFVPLLSGTI